MENFDVHKVDNHSEVIVVMKTCEPPLSYLNEIGKHLSLSSFSGPIIIDQLLHSGNTDERFIGCYFDGTNFKKESFEYKGIPANDQIRKYICEILKNDPEVIEFTILDQSQKRQICNGCYI